MSGLDERGWQLLALLQSNARASVTALARQLNLSRSAVQERIRRMEQNGIIAGYTLRLGKGAEERPRIRAQVMVEVAPRHHRPVELALARFAEVRRLHAVSGPFDLIALVETSSTEEMDDLLDRIGSIEGISKTHSAIILSTKVDR